MAFHQASCPCYLDAMKIPKWKIKGQKLGYKHHAADKLADNISHMTGRPIGANEVAHHIVAGGARQSAKDALAKIKALGVDVNEGANGIYLPKSAKYVKNAKTPHAEVHTETYYNELLKDLNGLNGQPDALRQKLQYIAKLLESNSYKY
jgi:hypothetical protein